MPQNSGGGIRIKEEKDKIEKGGEAGKWRNSKCEKRFWWFCFGLRASEFAEHTKESKMTSILLLANDKDNQKKESNLDNEERQISKLRDEQSRTVEMNQIHLEQLKDGNNQNMIEFIMEQCCVLVCLVQKREWIVFLFSFIPFYQFESILLTEKSLH